MVPIPLNYRCPLAPSTLGTQGGRQLCVKQAQEGMGCTVDLQTEGHGLTALYLGGSLS